MPVPPLLHGRLHLVNVRADYRVVLLMGSIDEPVLVAKGPVIINRQPAQPTQAHIFVTSFAG